MVVVQLIERCVWDAEVVGLSPTYHTKTQMSHSDLLHLTSNQDFVGLNPTIRTKQLPFSIMVITCDFDS